MKRSIYFRNFFTTALVVCLSFLILGGVFSAWSYRSAINDRREELSDTAADVAELVSACSLQWEPTGFEVRVAISSLAQTSSFHIMLADTDGNIISCSDRDFACRHMGKTVPPEIINQAYSGEYSEFTTLGGIYSSSRFTVGVPIVRYRSGDIMCFAFVAGDKAVMSEMWRHFAGIFFITALFVLLLTFVISFFTSKKQTEPLNEMSQAAHRFARGDFSTRVSESNREDEIGQLSAAFNLMAESLERSENNRREFIANVSHELKTPMTTIAGFADGILDGTIPPEHQAKYLGVISAETHRLSRLVRSMLDMSQLSAMDTATLLKGSFDICELIRISLLSLEQKITARKLDINIELPDDPVLTRGNRDSITQVVYNLIDNAIKFSPEGETLSIAVWKQGLKAYISVENRGETISQDELPLIFDRFHKTDKSRSSDRDGVGLGLYIVKTILDHHNEDIFVSSVNGVTKFVFTLSLLQQ